MSLKKFITALKYKPTSEIIGEIFCHGIINENYASAYFEYISFELEYAESLPLTKGVTYLLADAFSRWSWNKRPVEFRERLKYYIEHADHIYLYADLGYESTLYIGNVLNFN